MREAYDIENKDEEEQEGGGSGGMKLMMLMSDRKSKKNIKLADALKSKTKPDNSSLNGAFKKSKK